ncbi:ATP-dependent metallopeptidase FtsH/Yme1/Tma family protein, partial [Bradyrhizobium sp.]|uniref:ATP-dependent metallopeptidase FtsH/Yme1/Tma family protein n=1 Tax=Bradyrhizobium sp. TaxID=376 RepID=UPI003C42D5B8
VIVLAALASVVLIENHNKPMALRYSDFFNQLAGNNIASVTFSGTQINGALRHPLGQGEADGAAASKSFYSRVPDVGDPALLTELRKQHVPIAVTSSSAYWWGTSAVVGGLAALLLAKPMLLIIAAAFIAGLVRVARGGKMDMRSTLAMIPMFRSFADQTADHRETAGGIRPEDEMALASENRSKRAGYRSPLMWIVGLIVVALGVFGVVEMNKGPAAISYSGFLDQLDAGNVANVTIATTQIDGEFKQAVKVPAADKAEPQATFRTQAPSFGDPSLLPDLRQQHVVIDVVSSTGWLSWLARLPWPMVLIIAALLIVGLVKFVRGDKTTSGSAASSHAMTGMIAGLFGKAGLGERSPTISSREAPPKA